MYLLLESKVILTSFTKAFIKYNTEDLVIYNTIPNSPQTNF